MKIKSIIISAIAAVSAVSCCAPCSKSAPVIGDLENATWMLIEFELNPIENSPISIHFNAAEKMMYGTAPCNNFFAGYTLYDDPKHNIRFANVGATLRACPDMELEEKFAKKLPSITKAKLEGDYLMFTDSTDKLIAVLEKAKM